MKKLALVLFIVLAAAGLWWWESPRMATENLLDAARDGDTAELATLIDAEAFRASLHRLPPHPQAPRAKFDAPLAARGNDALLNELAGETDLILARRGGTWEIERRDLNRFRVVRREASGIPLPPLLFQRDGLHWKLVGVERAS
jgi:hypothetical protein